MRLFTIIVAITILAWACNQGVRDRPSEDNYTNIFVIDSVYKDSIMPTLQCLSDWKFSYFSTPIQYNLFHNDLCVDSVFESEFRMASWYSCFKDTVDLVAHIGQMETIAMLLRFTRDSNYVYFFRAPHENQEYFKLALKDSFTTLIEVPARKYKVKLSGIPDSVGKSIIYGYVDMESEEYYDFRDSLQKPYRASMKFFFRSQFRDIAD